MQKICSNDHLRDWMVVQMKDSGNGKSQTVEKINETMVYMQKERPRKNSHILPIAGRPNINEMSKRNEAIANQERKSFYTVAGKIVLLIIAIVFLFYFFS